MRKQIKKSSSLWYLSSKIYDKQDAEKIQVQDKTITFSTFSHRKDPVLLKSDC